VALREQAELDKTAQCVMIMHFTCQTLCAMHLCTSALFQTLRCMRMGMSSCIVTLLTWTEGFAHGWCRRQIQMQSGGGVAVPEMTRRIFAREGVPGFYRGFLPNALKNLPNKGAHAPGRSPLHPPALNLALCACAAL